MNAGGSVAVGLVKVCDEMQRKTLCDQLTAAALETKMYEPAHSALLTAAVTELKHLQRLLEEQRAKLEEYARLAAQAQQRERGRRYGPPRKTWQGARE